MRLWNGTVMYAPRTPDYYALPDMEHCIFRVMQKYLDVQAWNLYWLSQPQTDLIPLNRDNWRDYYHSFNGIQTRAFYQALEARVLNQMTLANIMSQPALKAIRLLDKASLDRTLFYDMVGGESWREMMLGRLFLSERLNSMKLNSEPLRGEVLHTDFILHRYVRQGSHEYKQVKRPA